MNTLNMKRIGSAFKWLIPLFAAFFLLLSTGGCTRPAQGTSAPETTTAAATAEETTAAQLELLESSTAASAEATKASEQESLPPETESESTAVKYETEPSVEEAPLIEEDGSYTSKEDVALYIHTYGWLPDNFLSKKEANSLGWQGGDLHKYAPGMSIGGDNFGNYEKHLPTKKGRKYYECDIDYNGGKRNAKRIVFSNDGLIFYTDDHYNSFTQLY